MATMHYFWMKFDCLEAAPTARGGSAAASIGAPGLKEITGGTVRPGGGGPGGVQGSGTDIQGGTVRSGGGGGGSGPQSSGTGVQGGTVRQGGGSGGGTGPQGAGSGGGAVTLGGTVRSRAETAAAKAGVVSFHLLHERAGGIIGNGWVSFYGVGGQAATRFPDEASALNERSQHDFKMWVGNSVAVLTCIETP